MEKALNELIGVFHHRTDKIHIAVLGHLISPDTGKVLAAALEELQRLNLIGQDHDRDGYERYFMHHPVREKVASIPKEFNGRPYEYFRDLEEKSRGYTEEKAFLEIEKLRTEFKDYPIVKNRARDANRISILALLVAVGLLIVEVKQCSGNKKSQPAASISQSR